METQDKEPQKAQAPEKGNAPSVEHGHGAAKPGHEAAKPEQGAVKPSREAGHGANPEPKHGAKPESRQEAKPEAKQVRHILRVAGVDLEGKTVVRRSLLKIKGIGIPLANAIVGVAGVRGKKTGDLTEVEVKRIEEILDNPIRAGLPQWMVNRRRDVETGKDLHLHGASIPIYKREDVSRLQKSRSYRGIRHALSLKLRGQRTRSTGRGNKSLGVVRKGSKVAKK